MHIFILVVIILTFCSCKDQKQSYQEEKFSVPYIHQSTLRKDSIRKKSTPFISDTWAPFVGKFKFSDTIVISEERDTSIAKDFTEGFDSKINSTDTLNSDGLQIIPDYRQIVPWRAFPPGGYYYYYPVFIVNETESCKVL